MIVNNEKISLPLVGKLSFFKLKESLEQLKQSDEPHTVQFSIDLLAELEQCPELLEGTNDKAIIEKNMSLINRLMVLLFPTALTLNEIKGASIPFELDFIYTSQRLRNILDVAGDDFSIQLQFMNRDRIYQMGCLTILQAYYQYPVALTLPFIIDIPDENGDTRYYRSAFNADLLSIEPTEKAIEISQEDYWYLMDNYQNVELWKEKFPPESWTIKGVGLLSLMDITVDQSINMMTSNLLKGTREAFNEVMENIRSLLRINDLQVGFIAAEHGSLLALKRYYGGRILLSGIEDQMSYHEAFTKEQRQRLLEEKKEYIVSCTRTMGDEIGAFLRQQLDKKGIKSYLISPLWHEGKLLGFVEVGSSREREINSVLYEKLSITLPILGMAASRFKQEALNRVEAIIQHECTTIHPSVKWRFEQAAMDYLEIEDAGGKPEFPDLLFPDVFPLYGQMDIRSSSTIRNHAVAEDLSLQLRMVKSVLEMALTKEHLPVYEEMLYRVDSYLEEFKSGLLEGSEQKILDFLRADVYPIFDYLKAGNPDIAVEIDTYESKLNSDSNTIYNKRKAFDDSVSRLNNLMAEMIDKKQDEAQQMFPHYFERYKTDGLEYNMYIGQSITSQKRFNAIYLNNLQLWQLTSMCEMEYALHSYRSELPTPLEVASLVFVHNSSLTIHFRVDEKRFDVEGTYNARYEIIKKRIDKAHIKGTDERITVPGKIAIIYTTIQDEMVYLKHLQFLEAKRYIKKNSIEFLEVEELQGVSGLKALRVAINYDVVEKDESLQEELKEFQIKID
jgi:hypothetical protein